MTDFQPNDSDESKEEVKGSSTTSSSESKKRKSDSVVINEKKIGVLADGSNGKMVNAITTRDFGSNRWTAASQRRFNGLSETEGESIWQGPFFFAQLADTQFGAIEQNATDAPEDVVGGAQELSEQTLALAEGMLKRLKKARGE